jgi:fatty acid desaturase (delta-4 desaturase)
LHCLGLPVNSRFANVQVIKTAGRGAVKAVGGRASLKPLRTAMLERDVATAQPSIPAGADPWEDEKWSKYTWTVYRGEAYDLTSYLAKHPGGKWLINLAIGRDCTGLFESYHLRPEIASAAFKRLPKLEDFPVEAVPKSPYPNDSELYNTIRCALIEH